MRVRVVRQLEEEPKNIFLKYLIKQKGG